MQLGRDGWAWLVSGRRFCHLLPALTSTVLLLQVGHLAVHSTGRRPGQGPTICRVGKGPKFNSMGPSPLKLGVSGVGQSYKHHVGSP